MITSEQINEIAAALALAQAEIEGAIKGKENPHFRSKYADLGAVWDACREPLTKQGIAVLQPIRHEGGTSFTVTRLVHKSGQWMEDAGVPLLLGKQDMQGLGSALTYSRRYGLMSMVGIAPEDDDGNAASGKANGKAHAQAQAMPTTPEGYDDWLTDLSIVAESGTAALKAAWTKSAQDYRDFLMLTSNAKWEQLKKLAAKASAQVPA